MKQTKKVLVLFSGAGSNLENLIAQLHNKNVNDMDIEIVAALTNNPQAGGLHIAQEANITTEVLDHTLFPDRESFDAHLVASIQNYLPDIVVMAGFMRILTPVFTSQIKAINLHPSLLPLHKGAKAIEKSFESEDTHAGVSVHYVNDELDGGAIIVQHSFEKDPSDSLDTFTGKIKFIEHEILPLAVIKVLST